MVNYELIGVSKNIKKIKEVIDKIADTRFNILISGETGVGKEIVARKIYQVANMKHKPFIKINCAALPENLFESEFFGYIKGAFTGANSDKKGKIHQAKGGILYLDEIGEMSLIMQSKLLRVIEHREFSPLGSNRIIRGDCWFICATNHNLEKNIQTNEFRKDLFFRINTVRIHIEPLRKRKEDIPYLIEYIIEKLKNSFKDRILSFPSPETLSKLTTYDWPGNVRELENILKQLVVLKFREDDLTFLKNAGIKSQFPTHDQSISADNADYSDFLSTDIYRSLMKKSISLKDIKKQVSTKVERQVLMFALKKTGWNCRKAADLLDVSTNLIFSKKKQFNIVPPKYLK